MFIHYEQHDTSSTFISPSDQGRTLVIIPQKQSNRHKYHQFSNMIPIKHQCSNPQQRSNRHYRLQFLTNTHRLALWGEAPYPPWESDFQNIHKNMIRPLSFQERSWPWTPEYLEETKYLPRRKCLIHILCIFTKQWRKMMPLSFKGRSQGIRELAK